MMLLYLCSQIFMHIKNKKIFRVRKRIKHMRPGFRVKALTVRELGPELRDPDPTEELGTGEFA